MVSRMRFFFSGLHQFFSFAVCNAVGIRINNRRCMFVEVQWRHSESQYDSSKEDCMVA